MFAGFWICQGIFQTWKIDFGRAMHWIIKSICTLELQRCVVTDWVLSYRCNSSLSHWVVVVAVVVVLCITIASLNSGRWSCKKLSRCSVSLQFGCRTFEFWALCKVCDVQWLVMHGQECSVVGNAWARRSWRHGWHCQQLAALFCIVIITLVIGVGIVIIVT